MAAHVVVHVPQMYHMYPINDFITKLVANGFLAMYMHYVYSWHNRANGLDSMRYRNVVCTCGGSVLVTTGYQGCGAVTFLVGSGSDSGSGEAIRLRLRLRLQVKLFGGSGSGSGSDGQSSYEP